MWKTLKGKDVKTSDGQDLGEIKEVSENYLHVEKGTIHKEKFWIPKYVADAFDGKTLWLLIGEDELRGKYQYGKEPPTGEKYAREFESFNGIPYGQKVNYVVDSDENIRVVENYSNIRSSHLPEGYGLKPRPAEDQIHVTEIQEAESSKENESKEKDKRLEAERVDITEYASKQPIRPVHRFSTDSKHTEPKVREIKNADSTSSSPIRLPSSQTTSETLRKVTDEDRRKAAINADSASRSPVRITSEAHISKQSVATRPTAIAYSSDMSSSSPSPIRTSYEPEENVPKSSPLELGSTKMEVKARNNILPSASTESTAIMFATSTSVTSYKEIDKKPVLAEPMPTLKAEEEEQFIVVSEKNSESNLLGLKTPTLPSALLEETESTSSNLISTNSDQDSQLTFQCEKRTETTENVNSILDYYFNPFLTGMTMLQAWLDMYNELAAISTRLSLNWFDLL